MITFLILGVGLGVFFAGLGYVIAKDQTAVKVRRLEKALVNASKLDHKLPPKSKIYWDEHIGNKCRRCDGGKIIKRYRFRVASAGKGETILRETTSIYWCTACRFKGLSLKE